MCKIKNYVNVNVGNKKAFMKRFMCTFSIIFFSVFVRVIMPYYYFLDAVCRSQHFEKPQRAEFQNQMRDALRTSKERHRHRQHKQRRINPTIQRNL